MKVYVDSDFRVGGVPGSLPKLPGSVWEHERLRFRARMRRNGRRDSESEWAVVLVTPCCGQATYVDTWFVEYARRRGRPLTWYCGHPFAPAAGRSWRGCEAEWAATLVEESVRDIDMRWQVGNPEFDLELTGKFRPIAKRVAKRHQALVERMSHREAGERR